MGKNTLGGKLVFRTRLIQTLFVVCSFTYAQTVVSDRELASLLANQSTRERALATIVGSRNSKVPLLLQWTKNPPQGVNQRELNIGLADTFRQLRTIEAVPFLIKNISLSRWIDTNTWLKSAEVIEQRLPAVAALIAIGPEAADAVIRASWEPMTGEDRLAAIFTVYRIVSSTNDDSVGRDFFSSTLAEANLQRYWAEQGLKRLK
jgi:hypothetical protein